MKIQSDSRTEPKPTEQTAAFNPFAEFEKMLAELNPIEQLGATVDFLEKAGSHESLEVLVEKIC